MRLRYLDMTPSPRTRLRITTGILVAAPLALCKGSIFSGSVPVAPENAPGKAELILIDTDVQGPIGMELRESYDFFLQGTFYNSGTGLNEDYSMDTVEWDVTESSAPAEGLSIDADGSFEASAYPSASYPRIVSIDTTTSEGAPLDAKLKPIEFSDSQSLELSRASGDLDFSKWIASETSLTGDDALEIADPDDDGLSNLLEFALGTEPETGNTLSGFSHEYDSGTGISTFTLTIPKDRDGAAYNVQTTTDLSSKPAVWNPQTLTFSSDDGDSESWILILSGSNQLFGRLQVETYSP